MSGDTKPPNDRKQPMKEVKNITDGKGDTLLWFGAFSAVEKGLLSAGKLVLLQQYHKFCKAAETQMLDHPIKTCIPPPSPAQDHNGTRWVYFNSKGPRKFLPPIPLYFTPEGKMRLFSLPEQVQWIFFCELAASQLALF